MPPPCLRCDRYIHQSCSCYHPLWSLPVVETPLLIRKDEDFAFRTARANLRKAYNDAEEEDILLTRALSKARERRFALGEQFEENMGLATMKLLHKVIGLGELRDDIYQYLLPGEISAFHKGCGIPLEMMQIGATLSPLNLVLSGGRRLCELSDEGYQFTLISGTEKMLLLGLDSLESRNRDIWTATDRHWSSVLIVSKGSRIVPCPAAFIPLSNFSCPNRNADSITETTDEEGMGRTVTLSYGSDTMSIWMPVHEQLAEVPVVIPQAAYEGFVQSKHRPRSKFQSQIYYSHLTDRDYRVRCPLEHTLQPRRKTRENVLEPPIFTVQTTRKAGFFDPIKSTSYELGQPLM